MRIAFSTIAEAIKFLTGAVCHVLSTGHGFLFLVVLFVLAR